MLRKTPVKESRALQNMCLGLAEGMVVSLVVVNYPELQKFEFH